MEIFVGGADQILVGGGRWKYLVPLFAKDATNAPLRQVRLLGGNPKSEDREIRKVGAENDPSVFR